MDNFRILLDLELAYAFDRRAFAGITAAANENGHTRLVRRMNRNRWDVIVRDHPVDGVIVPRLTEAEQRDLIATGLPFVCLADVPGEAPNQYIVAMDEAAIGASAAQYFLEANFQNFACFGRPNALRYFSRRLGSFAEGASAAGYTCAYGPPSDGLPIRQNGEVEDENGWDSEAEAWFRALPKPVAVFTPSDAYAQVAVFAAREAGLRVPDDVAVLGVDDDDVYCMTTSPQLSSVITPGWQVGKDALELLLDVLAGKKMPHRTMVAPAGIVARGSTSDFALQDQDVIAAVRFIRERAVRGITVGQVADHVALSLRTLERRFLATLNHTVQDEIRRAKVNRAKRLLIDTDLPFVEVARLSGIVQQSQLNRLVKMDTGQTPKEFRASSRASRRA